MTNLARTKAKSRKLAKEVPPFNPIAELSHVGFRSEWAFTAGFGSILLSFISWGLSRAKRDDRAQSDRWGIFVGHWAPSFFALGIALKLHERD